MSFLSSLSSAVAIGFEQSHAIPAFLKAWSETGNPILAVRAYSAATAGKLDDAAATELETGLRTLLGWVEQGVVVLEVASRTAGNLGFKLLGIKLTLRRWEREAVAGAAGVSP